VPLLEDDVDPFAQRQQLSIGLVVVALSQSDALPCLGFGPQSALDLAADPMMLAVQLQRSWWPRFSSSGSDSALEAKGSTLGLPFLKYGSSGGRMAIDLLPVELGCSTILTHKLPNFQTMPL